MTLGNSPQPLTRRQLRELARENESASAGDRAASETAENQSVVDERPSNHSRHTSPVEKPVERGAAPSESNEKPPKSGKQTKNAGKQTPAVEKPAKPVATPAESVKKPAEPVEKPAAVRPAPAPLPIPDASPTAVVIDSVVVDPGHALTRRELRALQAAASASAPPATEVPRAASGTETPSTDQRSTEQRSTEQRSAEQRSTDQRSTETPSTNASGAGSRSAVPATASDAEASRLHPPIGHWSVDRDDDSHIEAIGRRDDQTFDDLVGRGIGSGGIPTTTNALILPAIPRQGPSGPITSTGEIMITGSIDLPRSLGATGQHPNLFDSSEMDRMLDQLDEGGHHNDVAPVSASRAVSTHTSTRGVMTPPRKRGASLPTVLAITAAVLAIGVLSLFVVGYAFNIY
jgi:hypothetical protein